MKANALYRNRKDPNAKAAVPLCQEHGHDWYEVMRFPPDDETICVACQLAAGTVPTNSEPDTKENPMKAEATKRLAMIRENHSENIKECRKAISKFCDELKANPFDAFRWGQGPLTISAKLRVSQEIVHLVDTMPRGKDENAMTPTERVLKLYEMMKNEAMRHARCVPSSSSGISNLVETHLTAAYADAAQDLEWSAAAVDDEV